MNQISDIHYQSLCSQGLYYEPQPLEAFLDSQLLRKSLKAKSLAISVNPGLFWLPPKTITNNTTFSDVKDILTSTPVPEQSWQLWNLITFAMLWACKPFTFLLSQTPLPTHRPSSFSFLYVHATLLFPSLTQPPVVPLLPNPFQMTFGKHTSTLRNISFSTPVPLPY